MGINLSMILTMACCVEGKIENDLRELIQHRRAVLGEIEVKDFYQRRIYNTFLNNIQDYLNAHVARITGTDNLEAIIGLLSHKRPAPKLSHYPNWEGIRTLFKLRNVLAHGREASARQLYAWWIDGGFQDQSKGGYHEAEQYLLKKGLLKKRFIETGSVDHLFTNKVTDHFCGIAKGFIRFHSKIIKEEKKRFSILDTAALVGLTGQSRGPDSVL